MKNIHDELPEVGQRVRLKTTSTQECIWDGKCFVYDQGVSWLDLNGMGCSYTHSYEWEPVDGHTEMEWISVKDRLPPHAGFWLVSDGFLGMVEKVEFDGKSRWNWMMTVTHWMPLPQPPVQEEQED